MRRKDAESRPRKSWTKIAKGGPKDHFGNLIQNQTLLIYKNDIGFYNLKVAQNFNNQSEEFGCENLDTHTVNLS